MPRLLPLPALLAASLAAAAHVPAPAAGPAAAAPRPVVLLVHGRGLNGADTLALRRAWHAALDGGVERVTGHRLLAGDDLRLVWYADALGSDATAACGADAPRASRQQGWARDMATTLEAAGTLMELAALWLGGPEGAALGALAGDLVYLGDEGRRCAAGERVTRALATAEAEGRPVVLVAHSFGALVSYHHLQARDADDGPEVARWVTVGSLLGHPELRQLLLDEGRGGLPPRVGSWVNVHDPADPFSAPLVGLGAGAPESTVEDRIARGTHDGDPHDPARYLGDPATVGAVLEAWCAAAGGAAEPACSAPAARRAAPGA